MEIWRRGGLYRGVRYWDGIRIVLCPDGSDLPSDPWFKFYWGNYSSESMCLARNLLRHHLSSADRAENVWRAFLGNVIAKLNRSLWTLSRAQIDKAIAEIEAEAATKEAC